MTDSTADIQPEFALLQKPRPAGQVYWATAIHQGEPVAFRVLGDDGVTPVDGAAYMGARVQQMHQRLQTATVHEAAALAYRAVFVEVSLLPDPFTYPAEEQRDLDCVVDLWPPLHVALMTGHRGASQALLQFHVEHAVDAMTSFANTPRSLARVKSGDALERKGSDSELAPARTPILDCQVRRELGGTVVLLGAFDGRVRYSASAAVRKSRPPSPAHGPAGAPVVTPLPSLTGDQLPHSTCDTPPHALSSTEEMLAQSVYRHNEELLAEESTLFEDQGEAYCLVNVLTALRPLLQSALTELDRRSASATTVTVAEIALDLVHDFCCSLSGLPQHPPLLVDGVLLFELCHHGDLFLLSRLMDAFEGALAPVLRGQALLTDRQNGSGVAPGVGQSSSGISTGSVLYGPNGVPSPHIASLTVPPPPPSSITCSPALVPAGRDQSVHSVSGTPRGTSLSRHAVTPASFWWSCRPQQVRQLAFMAHWISCREAVEESSGSCRRRRAVAISAESRVLIATLRQLTESPVAAQRLCTMVWSGHLVAVAKLLSRDCTLEDFMDFVEESAYFTVAPPSGFPGPVMAVLIAGGVAAQLVKDAALMRGLRRKVETLLVDLPGRPSALRSYVMARGMTHAERFGELWLDASSKSPSPADTVEFGSAAEGGEMNRPLKFRTRVELLYYAEVEQVVVAAEAAWAESEDVLSQNSSGWPTSTAKGDAAAALQNWVLMWSNFFTGLRDRTDHRRSLSYSSVSSQAQMQLGSSFDGGQLGRDRAAPHQHQRQQSIEHSSVDDATGEESGNEVIEAVQRVCRVLIDRLEVGDAPLPVIRRALFPGSGPDGPEGSSGRAHSGSAPPVHTAKTMPVSSIDQEFTATARAFGDMAGKESQDVQLKFYGLYKQATIGDVNIPCPGFFDYAGKAKWEAWSKLKGMSLLDAKRAYVSEYKMMIDLRRSRS